MIPKTTKLGTHQISNISHLYSIMNDLRPSASIPPVKHRLVYDQSGLDVLGGLPDVAPPPVEGPEPCVLPPAPRSLFFGSCC